VRSGPFVVVRPLIAGDGIDILVLTSFNLIQFPAVIQLANINRALLTLNCCLISAIN
jgi:hypothetical protein